LKGGQIGSSRHNSAATPPFPDLSMHPHPVGTGSPTEHTCPNPSPGPTLQHQTIIQLQLKPWKAAGLEQGWESAIFLPNGEWCQNHSSIHHDGQ